MLDAEILSFDKDELNDFIEEHLLLGDFNSSEGCQLVSAVLDRDRGAALSISESFFSKETEANVIICLIDAMLGIVGNASEKSQHRSAIDVAESISWRYKQNEKLANLVRDKLFLIAELLILCWHGREVSREEAKSLVVHLSDLYSDVPVDLVEIAVSDVVPSIEGDMGNLIQQGVQYIFRYRDSIWSETPYKAQRYPEPILHGSPDKWLKISKIDQVWKIVRRPHHGG